MMPRQLCGFFVFDVGGVSGNGSAAWKLFAAFFRVGES